MTAGRHLRFVSRAAWAEFLKESRLPPDPRTELTDREWVKAIAADWLELGEAPGNTEATGRLAQTDRGSA